MKRIALVSVLPILLVFSGCSMFGIATRSQLDEQNRVSKARHDQMRQENRALHERIAKLDALLAESETALERLRDALGELDLRAETQRQEIWSQTGTLQVRMASIEDRIGLAAATSDSIREGLAQTRYEAQVATSRVLEVRDDLNGVAHVADVAQARSEALLRAWLEQLRSERQRLQRQLGALEASLDQWEAGLGREEAARDLSSPSSELDTGPVSFAPRR